MDLRRSAYRTRGRNWLFNRKLYGVIRRWRRFGRRLGNQSLNRPFDGKSGLVGQLLFFVNACDANSSELDRQRACQRGPDLPFLLRFIVKRFRHRKLDTREVKKLRKPAHRLRWRRSRDEIHSADHSLATDGDSRSFWAAQEGRRGGTGRRAGLKIQVLARVCGFDPLRRHISTFARSGVLWI